MTKQVVTITPETDLADVADTLERRKLKRLPVVQNGRLVGMITRADLVRALVARSAMGAAGIPRDPAALVEAIHQRMRREKWLDSSLISVTVQDGVAELTGLAASADQRRALTLLVEGTPGVVRVNDRMHLKPAAPMV